MFLFRELYGTIRSTKTKRGDYIMLEGSRTILFNAILVIVGLSEATGYVFPENFAADVNGAVLAVVGVIGVILRAITKGPMGKLT